MSIENLSEDHQIGIAIYSFLKEFNKLENKIKEYFDLKVDSLDHAYKNQLYFYYGGLASKSIYIKYDTKSLSMYNVKYEKDIKIKRFTLNQILNLVKENIFGDVTYLNFNSLQQSSMYEFSFIDAVLKLINLRNRFAHEMININLTQSDCIELLSKEELAKFDIYYEDDGVKDHELQIIFSNIAYINVILNKIETN